tara:strand:- start:1659 stop:1892 length:234 start_codon:yes stop_codon:yes gene_type:complete
MTHLIVDSEGELELGIGIAVELAQTSEDPIELELTFPSVGLMKIFSTNLVRSFVNNNVPKENKLQLVFNVPEEDDEY